MRKEGEKSLKVNMILNAIKGLMSILFPLITFPYAANILGVENLGKYNFASSIINYLVLFAGLGISAYAIREGARIRENSDQINDFVSEVFTINVASTALSYIVFFILLSSVRKFLDYRQVLIILSIQVGFRTIGIEWVYSIYEDYMYITIRSIVFQIISLIFLFVFVRNENDLYKYAFITVVSTVGSNILNLLHSKKYIKLKIIFAKELTRHLKPILLLFAMTVAVTVYVASDTTMLGFLCDDYTVGIYSVSTKVYTIIKTILSSILVVSIPRLSALLGQRKQEEFNAVSSDIIGILYTLVMPCITGIIILRNEIVLLISSENYIAASSSLAILGVALFFCLGSWFWGQCILVPEKCEKEVFVITVISAVTNIILNFFLIPIWKENAAAITTVIAEAITFIWCWIIGRKYVKISNSFSIFFKAVIGCGMIYLTDRIIQRVITNRLVYLVLFISISIVLYGSTELLLKNPAATSIVVGIKKRIYKIGGHNENN